MIAIAKVSRKPLFSDNAAEQRKYEKIVASSPYSYNTVLEVFRAYPGLANVEAALRASSCCNDDPIWVALTLKGILG